MARCLFVSVCHKSVFYRNVWTNRAGFLAWRLLRPILHFLGNSGIYKKGTSLQKFVVNSGLTKFRHGTLMVESVVSSTKVGIMRDMRDKLNHRRSTKLTTSSTVDG